MSITAGAALLAGGRSSRMGQDKAELLLEGRTFTERIAAELGGFPERLLSTGSRALSVPGFLPVPDLHPGCGPLAGLEAVLSRCRSDALLVVPCDLPLFTAELGHFLAGQLAEPYDAVIPAARDGRLHPACGVYRKSCLAAVERQLAAGELRLYSLLDRLRVLQVPLEGTAFEDGLLANINTPQAYAALKEKLKAGGALLP